MMTNIFDCKFYVFLHLFTIFLHKMYPFCQALFIVQNDRHEWQTVYLTQGPI